MNRRFVDEVIERSDLIVAEKRHDLGDPVLLHFNLILAKEGVRLDELAAKLLFNRIHQGARPWLLMRPLRLRRSGRRRWLRARRRWRRFWDRSLGRLRRRCGLWGFRRRRRW